MFRLLLVLMLSAATVAVAADFTPTHRRQLRTAQGKLGVAARHLRSGDEAAAREAVAEAEAIVQAIRDESGYEADHVVFGAYNRLLASRREDLGDASGQPAASDQSASGRSASMAAASSGVSFSDEVAPIIQDKCVRCHGAGRASAGLRLDSFAALKRAARGGPLVTPGDPDRSLLLARIMTDDVLRRMPKNGAPLPDSEVLTVGKWIREGARFDGTDEAAMLGSAAAARPKELPEGVTIPQPTGSETVSFTRDIAPFFVDMCVNCHSGPNARSGLSLASFHDMMVGGDSGTVVIPGDRENSRLFRLTGGLELPRMPDTRARLTRKNYEDLKTWFDEGCKFDGDDPKALLTSFVKTEDDLRREAVAAMDPAERGDLVRQRLESQLKKALSSIPMQIVTVDTAAGAAHVGGDLKNSELQPLAEAAADQLAKSGELAARPLDRTGGVAVIVMSSSYGFREAVRTVTGGEPPTGRTVVGHVDGDAVTAIVAVNKRPGNDDLTTEHRVRIAVAEAVARTHGGLPQWLAIGSGVALASDKSRPFRAVLASGGSVIGRTSGGAIFEDDSYTASTIDEAAAVIVSGLVESGGTDRLKRLLAAIGGGEQPTTALQSVYDTSAARLGENLKRTLR